MRRPQVNSPSAGLLGFEQFQMAYVTNDLDKALPIMRERLGISNFTIFQPAPGAPMRIALAWSAGTMIEVIDASGMGIEIYDKVLPSEFGIRFHHIGVQVPDEAAWDRLQNLIAAGNHQIDFADDLPMLRYAYVPVPELGHYVEYIMLRDEGRAFFESVAAN